MYMDNQGIIHSGIAYIPDDCVLEEAFRIKIWKAEEDGFVLIGVTEAQDEFPDEDRLKWAISYFKGTFAEVVKIFYLAKIPFTDNEEYGPHICADCKRPREDCELRLCPNSLYMDDLEMEAYRREVSDNG